MILVAGLGNLLMGDDGVGPRVTEQLEREPAPEGVEFADLGTPGLGLVSYLAGYRSWILVDAVTAPEGQPGEVRRYGYDQLRGMATGPRLGPHDPSLADTLAYLEMTAQAPEDAVLIGVVVRDCAMGIGLTAEVEAALPVICRMVREEIARFQRER